MRGLSGVASRAAAALAGLGARSERTETRIGAVAASVPDRPGRTRTLSRSALCVLLGGLALRLILLPITAGNDFKAYNILASLALRGHDVYALQASHQLPTLAWAYPPLLLNLYTGLQWLALYTGWPFPLLGKLPVVAADLAVGLLLYRALRRHGRGERVALCGMALYLYNPLVLYNGAFYGRFDAVALAFLLLALENYRTRLFAPAYALAISAKTFPLFLLPLLAFGRDRQSPRRLALAGILVLPLALPYIVTDPRGLLSIFAYNRQSFGRLSWYEALLQGSLLSEAQTLWLARACLWLYPPALLLLVRSPLWVKAAGCFALYLALNQVVYEQYLLWPLPFLILVGLRGWGRASRGSRDGRGGLALLLAALLTVAGMLENEYTWEHPESALHYHLVPTPWVPLNIALALAVAAFTIVEGRRSKVEREPDAALA